MVIGASAGGVQALDQLVERLPPELPAAVFVVLHLAAGGRSVLPSILARMGPLPASVPSERQIPERGHIYVAPPDRHMLLVGDRCGSRAGRARTAIGPQLTRCSGAPRGPTGRES